MEHEVDAMVRLMTEALVDDDGTETHRAEPPCGYWVRRRREQERQVQAAIPEQGGQLAS